MKSLLFVLLLLAGCSSNDVLKRFTITVDCENMVGRIHNEFQADSCFKIGSKFIAFTDKDSIVYYVSEFCGTICIRCNEDKLTRRDQITEEGILSAQKK